MVIAVAGPERLYEWVIRFTAPELTGYHPALHAIRSGATRLAEGSHEFVIFYLLVHGTLKLGIVLALLRGGGRCVFPVASLILAGFVMYMSWRARDALVRLAAGLCPVRSSDPGAGLERMAQRPATTGIRKAVIGPKQPKIAASTAPAIQVTPLPPPHCTLNHHPFLCL